MLLENCVSSVVLVVNNRVKAMLNLSNKDGFYDHWLGEPIQLLGPLLGTLTHIQVHLAPIVLWNQLALAVFDTKPTAVVITEEFQHHRSIAFRQRQLVAGVWRNADGCKYRLSLFARRLTGGCRNGPQGQI